MEGRPSDFLWMSNIFSGCWDWSQKDRHEDTREARDCFWSFFLAAVCRRVVTLERLVPAAWRISDSNFRVRLANF
jgi:hypothetical protein